MPLQVSCSLYTKIKVHLKWSELRKCPDQTTSVVERKWTDTNISCSRSCLTHIQTNKQTSGCKRNLAHSVLRCLGHLTELTLEVNVDSKVKVPIILDIGFHADGAKDLLSSLYCQIIIKVEHGLLPVSVRRLWASRESGPLVATSELYVKVGYQRMDVVIPFHLEAKR